MKAIWSILFFQLLFCTLYSQDAGKIIFKNKKPIAGEINTYIYEPPKHLAIPVKLYALVVYEIEGKNYFRKIAVNKISGYYQFSFKTHDSAYALILSLTDENNNPIDNNNELGFVSLMYDKNGNVPYEAYIAAMDLLSFYAIRPLKLDYDKLTPIMIDLFEEGYKKATLMKKDKPYYTYYLTLLYHEKKDAVKSKLLEYAMQMELAKNDEKKWMNAIKIYRLLKMYKKCLGIEEKSLIEFPNGEIAKSRFLNEFEHKDTTEISMLAAMNNYIHRFQDTSSQMRYTFYSWIIGRLLYNGNYDRLTIYEPLMPSKIALGNMYDNYALKLSGGEQLNNNGSNIVLAKMLSKKSLDYAYDLLLNSSGSEDNDGNVQRVYDRYAETYALILFKSGKFDSAFYYQDLIYRQRSNLDIASTERYDIYAEKAKGPKFAYQLVEDQLLQGISSPAMIDLLNSFAKKSDIPDSTYYSLKIKAANLAAKISTEQIKKMFGDEKARDFILRNLRGKKIALSSFKNKVVVLDFWATWCMPCLVSFAGMKQTESQYKNDNEVQFLFIDTWEDKSLTKMQEKVNQFIKKNDYDFEILLDAKNKVADEYKVKTIPARFIINKKGKIVFIGDSSNLSSNIESAKN